MGAKGSKPKRSTPIFQVNNLINKANEAITCGPDCQKQKNIDDLQKKYLDAQSNLATAPQQLSLAEKNYYVAFKGIAYYNDFLNTQLQGKADLLGNTLTTNFNQNIKMANEYSRTYNTLYSDYENIITLLDGFINSNKTMKNELTDIQKDVVTNDRKTYYEYQHYNVMKNWYFLFKWIYIILVFAFILGSLSINTIYSWRFKLFILALLILYPFVIDFIVIYVLQLLHRIYELLPTNVYSQL